MQVNLVRIGNSRGVRIPKAIIDQCGLGESVDLRVEEGRIILARGRKPREGWRNALERASETISDDELLLETVPVDEFDQDEWTW